METQTAGVEKQRVQVESEIHSLSESCARCEEQLAQLLSRLLNSVMRDEPDVEAVGEQAVKCLVPTASKIRECRWVVQSMAEKISSALERLEV